MELVSRLAAETSEQPAFYLGRVQDELRPELVSPSTGMLAAIDQHGAAVRDVLGPGVGELAAGDLAAYARGIVEVASEQDWYAMPPQTQLWLTLRLASVCILAHQFDHLSELAPISAISAGR